MPKPATQAKADNLRKENKPHPRAIIKSSELASYDISNPYFGNSAAATTAIFYEFSLVASLWISFPYFRK